MESAPLRRLDWRFLLPTSAVHADAHVVLVGAEPGVAARLRETGVVRRVSTEFPGAAEPADLVAVFAGGTTAVRRAAEALRPGGVLYAECGRRPVGRGAGSPRAVEAAARGAGMAVVGHYAILPRPDVAKVYLPLATPAALRWVVEAMVPASTPLRWAVQHVLRSLGAEWGAHALHFYPFQALVAVRPPSRALGPAALGLGAASRSVVEARPLLLCDAGNRVVMLPFATGAAQPMEVIKVPKLPVFNDRTLNEQLRLAQVRERVAPALLDSLPEPRGIRYLGGVAVTSESYRHGISLQASSAAWRASWQRRSADLGLATRWLSEFHRSTTVANGRWDAVQRELWIEHPLHAFADRFGTTAAEERLFTELRSRAQALDGRPFPTVWWHRDFNIWNLFRDGDRLIVIDWEGARPGPPLCDLLHFCTHWYEAVRGLRSEMAKLRGFRDLFIHRPPGDQAAAAVFAAIGVYLERLGLDPGFVPVLLGFTWIELALRRAEQLRDQAQVGSDPRAGNRNFPFIAALAEAVERMPSGATGRPSATTPRP